MGVYGWMHILSDCPLAWPTVCVLYVCNCRVLERLSSVCVLMCFLYRPISSYLNHCFRSRTSPLRHSISACACSNECHVPAVTRMNRIESICTNIRKRLFRLRIWVLIVMITRLRFQRSYRDRYRQLIITNIY